MTSQFNQQFIEIRTLLENPYAYMDEIDYSSLYAKEKEASIKQKAANKLMGNPYESLNSTHSNSLPPSKKKYSLPLSLKTTQNPYASFYENNKAQSKIVQMGNPYALINDTDDLEKNEIQYNKPISRIEQIARNLQKNIWKNRNTIWPNGVPSNSIDMLDPSIGFKSIGYDYDIYETLDDFANGASYKVAGLIDQDNKKAYISNDFEPEVQRFTSAHELGHALLHSGISGLHRDRALTGGAIKGRRSKIEKEADKFASFYLMPRNLLIRCFEKHFLTQSFILTEATSFALDPSGKMNLLSNKVNLRYLSRILAKTKLYNGKHFSSLSEQFHVSVEAMAIRLEELELVKV